MAGDNLYFQGTYLISKISKGLLPLCLLFVRPGVSRCQFAKLFRVVQSLPALHLPMHLMLRPAATWTWRDKQSRGKQAADAGDPTQNTNPSTGRPVEK